MAVQLSASQPCSLPCPSMLIFRLHFQLNLQPYTLVLDPLLPTEEISRDSSLGLNTGNPRGVIALHELCYKITESSLPLMDPIGVFAACIGAVKVSLDVADAIARHGMRGIRLLKLYGPSGLFLFWFGSKLTWRMEAQVLGEMADEDASAFKKCVQDECTMVSVAVSIFPWLCRGSLLTSCIRQPL